MILGNQDYAKLNNPADLCQALDVVEETLVVLYARSAILSIMRGW